MRIKADMRFLRMNSGLTAKDAGGIAGVSEGTIYNWEKGRSSPTLTPSQTKSLIKGYGCTLDDLVEAVERSGRAR